MTYTEVRRQLAERAALAQDAAASARRRSDARAEVLDMDTSAEERRNWALQEARQSGTARRIGGAPQLVAWVNPDGSTNIRDDPDRPGKTLATVVHTPRPVFVGECRIWTDDEEAEYRRRHREAENALLASRYDLGELVAAGIMTPDEAEHPAVRTAAAGRHEPEPGRGAPYRLEDSVRLHARRADGAVPGAREQIRAVPALPPGGG